MSLDVPAVPHRPLVHRTCAFILIAVVRNIEGPECERPLQLARERAHCRHPWSGIDVKIGECLLLHSPTRRVGRRLQENVRIAGLPLLGFVESISSGDYVVFHSQTN